MQPQYVSIHHSSRKSSRTFLLLTWLCVVRIKMRLLDNACLNMKLHQSYLLLRNLFSNILGPSELSTINSLKRIKKCYFLENKLYFLYDFTIYFSARNTNNHMKLEHALAPGDVLKFHYNIPSNPQAYLNSVNEWDYLG